MEDGGVENSNPKCNPNPNPKRVSDPEFNSHLRWQTKCFRHWLSLTLKKTTIPNSKKVSGSELV